MTPVSCMCWLPTGKHIDPTWMWTRDAIGLPANTRHSAIVGSMLGQRHRRWTNIETTMAQCLVIVGLYIHAYYRPNVHVEGNGPALTQRWVAV